MEIRCQKDSRTTSEWLSIS